MIHYLRNERGDTLLDLEVYTDDGTTDVRSDVNIHEYTDFLLSHEDDKDKQKIKMVFDKLSEARGWYWEVYRERINKNPTIKDVEAMIGLMVQSAAGVTKLDYITG
jgi:hypothetical protein